MSSLALSLSLQGKAPPQRFGMTMTALDNEKAIIMGGRPAALGLLKDGEEVPKNGEWFNDVHVLIWYNF